MVQQPDGNSGSGTPLHHAQVNLSQVNHSAFEGKKILIVDDNVINHRLMSLITRNWVSAPLFASSGADALRLLATEQVDIVLTDMYMAGMDGIALLSAIRNHPAANRLPVILVSAGRFSGAELAELRKKGFSAILPRPFTEKQLILTLYTALNLPAPSALD